MYALIEFSGKQYRVEEGSSIKVPHLEEKVGSKVTFDKILYFDDGKTKKVGHPTVSGANIDGEIVSHGRDKKVVVFKFKRRKGYQRKNTHRQEFSMIKVGKLASTKKAAPKKKTESTDKKVTPKKTAAKTKPASKTAPKKTTPKKTAPKKPAAKKVAPKKTAAKKPATKKKED